MTYPLARVSSLRLSLPALALASIATLGCAASPVRVSTIRPEETSAPAGGVVEAIRAAAGTEPSDPPRNGGTWDPGYFEHLIPAHTLEIEGLRDRHLRRGVGVPLVGVRTPSAEEWMFPPEGVVRPITAVVVHDEDGAASIRLLDPTVHASVATSRGTAALAADFTAPYAFLLARTRLAGDAILTTLRAENAASHAAGVFLLEPYDPEKIPVLMIHGLVSSPLTWRELTNTLLGDPTLRARFQIWHAVYPTGLPYLHAAADFRDRLRALRRHLDPERDDRASQQTVVVAHSKGGLLAHTLVSDSGERLWNAAFSVPPEALEASDEDRQAMRRVLRFERDPTVTRVVFLASPHRGSELSESPLARAAASFIALPGDAADAFERVLEGNEAVLSPEFGSRRETGLPSGPRALSNRDPLIRALADLPIEVPFHTILGQPGDEPTDGVVSHESSRLPGAASERVVPGAGHDVHHSEAAIREVLRILREHAAGVERPRREE